MFRKRMVVITTCLIFSCAAGCVKAADIARIEDGVPTISVSGTAKITVVPDQAKAIFGVESEHRSLARAYSGNTESMNAVISSLKALGVDAADMRTSSYSVTPVYRRDEKGHRIPGKPSTYRVSQRLTVKIRDLSRAGEVIDSVMAAGANTFSGIWFDSSGIEDIREQAKADAAGNARAQARLIAESLSVKLGRVLRVDKSSSPDYPAPRKMMAFAENAAAAPSIEAGSMDVTATCNVVYEIVQ